MRLIGIGTAIGGLLGLIGAAATAAATSAISATTTAAVTTSPTTTSPYALPPSLSVTVTGGGRVVGPGIRCTRRCSERFDSARMLTLMPQPAPGHYFTYWGGACWGEGTCRVSINGPQSVEASFIALPNTQITSHRLTGTRLTLRLGGTGGAGRPQFRCRLDRGRVKTCASPTIYAGLRPGRHTVTVQAIDGNSRRDPTPARLAFTVR